MTVFDLAKMTWPEVQEALKTADLALIPTGSVEQHGPAGTLGMDAARAEAFSLQLAQRLHPKAVLVPTQAYGISARQMGFAGTVTLRPETYISVYTSVVESLYRHGLRKFLFLNATAANAAGLEVLSGRLKGRWPEIRLAHVQYTAIASAIARGEVAAFSEALYLVPDAVRPELLGPASLVDGVVTPPPAVNAGVPASSVTANGLLSDLTEADAQLGEQIVTEALDYIVTWVGKYL